MSRACEVFVDNGASAEFHTVEWYARAKAVSVSRFSSRRRNTRFDCEWSSDVCSSDLPSRLPRMLVEYHPDRPSMRALNAGASTLFIIVWPVLKSLPPIGTWRSSASRSITGRSTVRRPEEGREGKGVNLGGRRFIKNKE